MTIEQFITKAVKGGWKQIRELTEEEVQSVSKIYIEMTKETHEGYILLDPNSWRAVGRVEGWEAHPYDPVQTKMVGMVNALIDGKTIEDYLKTL